MFSGSKAGFGPFTSLTKAWTCRWERARLAPVMTIVPLYRNHVFAQIKPTTRTRIDFGFALGDTKAKGRLIDTEALQRRIALLIVLKSLPQGH